MVSIFCKIFPWKFSWNNTMILYKLTKFKYHAFFTFQDTKQVVPLNSSLETWWRHKVYLQSHSSITPAMADSRSQRGREKYEILNILQKKSFFDQRKRIFNNFSRVFFGWNTWYRKTKKLKQQLVNNGLV